MADKHTSCVGVRETYQSELKLAGPSDIYVSRSLSDNILWLKVEGD